MNIDWSLLNNALARPNPGLLAQQGFERGAVQGALGMLRRDPNNAGALNALMTFAPEVGVQMEERAFRAGERQRVALGRDMTASYLLGGDAGAAQPQAAGATPKALLATLPPGFGVTAEQARERAIRADPETFLEADGRNTQNQRQRVQLSQEQFELVRDLNEESLRLLGGIEQVPEEQRQAAWEAAIQEAEALYSRFGLNIRDHVPAQYDAATYARLMRTAMKTRDQFAVMNDEARLDWDITDDEADNARADRGMDSLIGYRQGRLGLMARGQDMTDARVRRGQDMSSRDRRRGQDMRPQGRGRGGNAARAQMPDGRTIVVRNGRWVYEGTGQPVQ